MSVWMWIGIAVAVFGAAWLIKTGHEEYYFSEFLINVIFQLIFVGGVCIALWGAGRFSRTYLYIAIAASFVLVFLGWLTSSYVTTSRTIKKNQKEERVQNERKSVKRADIRKAIKNGGKYNAYMIFIRNNTDRIGAIFEDGRVLFTPAGVSMFTSADNGYELTTYWNPKLGDPRNYKVDNKSNEAWHVQQFFEIREGERQWTSEEKTLINELIRESLPGGAGNWDGKNGRYYRKVPAVIKKKARKDPY